MRHLVVSATAAEAAHVPTGLEVLVTGLGKTMAAAADETVLATGDVFITDPAVRAGLAARADLVDMEGYAVAWACRQAGVPVRLVKHVSDNADAEAMGWPQLVDASARVLGEWLTANCERSAP